MHKSSFSILLLPTYDSISSLALQRYDIRQIIISTSAMKVVEPLAKG